MTQPDFELLIKATEQIKYPDLSASGDASFAVGDREFVGRVIASTGTSREFLVECEDGRGEFSNTDMGRYGSIAPVFRATALDGRWAFADGFLQEWSYGEEPRATIRFRSRRDAFSKNTPAASAIIYAGGSNINFSDPIPVPHGVLRPWFLEKGFRFRMFGREALIRRLEMPQLDEYGRTLAVAWLGKGLSEDWPRALRVLMSFVLGNWVTPFMEYSVDAEGQMIERQIYTLHKPDDRTATPALDLYDSERLQELAKQFDDMIVRCKKLFKKKAPLDVCLGHLLADHDGLEIEIRDIALALDSLIESPLFEPPRSPLIGLRRFQTIQKALLSHLARLVNATEADFSKRVKSLLRESRFDSIGARRKRFWGFIGITPTAKELKALKHRNTMSHKGFIGFDAADDAQWNRFLTDRGLLRTLVNRVLLSLLGFTGKTPSYVGTSQVQVNACSLSRPKQPR